MMPHTVPNNPMNGAVEPVVASQLMRASNLVSSSDEAICIARCTAAIFRATPPCRCISVKPPS